MWGECVIVSSLGKQKSSLFLTPLQEFTEPSTEAYFLFSASHSKQAAPKRVEISVCHFSVIRHKEN